MLTSEMKDKLLDWLVKQGELETSLTVRSEDLMRETGLTENQLHSLFNQLLDRGYLRDYGFYFGTFQWMARLELHDFWQKGGYLFQEQQWRTEASKMQLEIDLLLNQLGPDKLDIANKISGVVSGFTSAIAAALQVAGSR